ncbi:MAG: adenylate kinase [Vicinamibacterales bacterium]
MAAASSRVAHDAVRVIFLGPPGAGKGTQAARLAAHLGVPKISTGEMLRTAIARKTSLGTEANPLMEKGRLVPDDLLVKLISERTAEPDCTLGYVLDGFPRTLPQATGLELMPGGGPRGFIVFDFEVPRPVLMQRLSGRRWCPNCQATFHVLNDPPKQEMVCDQCGTKLVQRDDDLEVVVAQRLREYDERTFPLIEYYRARTRMVRIDGNRLQDEVFQDLLQAVEVRA